LNQHKTARRAERRGTRNHHQAIKTGRLEAMPVRKSRVGQRSMLLPTPTLTPIHVPWVSPWSYKRRDSGIERGETIGSRAHTLHTTIVFTPVQSLRCKIIQTSPPAGCRAFSCPNQDKSLCLLASPSGKGSTHINLLVGVTPRGENTDNTGPVSARPIEPRLNG